MCQSHETGELGAEPSPKRYDFPGHRLLLNFCEEGRCAGVSGPWALGGLGVWDGSEALGLEGSGLEDLGRSGAWGAREPGASGRPRGRLGGLVAWALSSGGQGLGAWGLRLGPWGLRDCVARAAKTEASGQIRPVFHRRYVNKRFLVKHGVFSIDSTVNQRAFSIAPFWCREKARSGGWAPSPSFHNPHESMENAVRLTKKFLFTVRRWKSGPD